jgi:hypothetical protein
MANPNPSPSTRFGAENAPVGRAKQKGARDRLSAALLTKFADGFEQHGEGVIAKVRENEPATYLRIAATIIPKELEMAAGPIDGLSDDEVDRALAYVREHIQQRETVRPRGA